MKKKYLNKFISFTIITGIILSTSIPVFASYTYQANGETQYYTDKKFTDEEKFTDGGFTYAILENNEVALIGFDENNLSFELNVNTINYSGNEYTLTYVAPDALNGNTAIKTISLPSVKAIGNNAFQGCKDLKEVDFPGIDTIGDEVFKGCESLTQLNIASARKIGTKVFVNCSSLKNLYLQGLDDKKNLSSSDFEGCSLLEKVVLSKETFTFNSTTSSTSTTESTTETTTNSSNKESSTETTTAKPQNSNYIKVNKYLKNPTTPVAFSDVPENHWARKEIEKLANYGIFNGLGNGLFNPNGNTTRADFIVALTNILGLDGNATASFSDVDPNAYYANRIALAEKSGILPTTGNKFNPKVFITREDAIVIIANACLKNGVKLNNNNAILNNFSDSTSISDSAKESVSMLINEGLISGNEKGQIEPKKLITRAELSKLMGSVFNLLIPEPSELLKY